MKICCACDSCTESVLDGRKSTELKINKKSWKKSPKSYPRRMKRNIKINAAIEKKNPSFEQATKENEK